MQRTDYIFPDDPAGVRPASPITLAEQRVSAGGRRVAQRRRAGVDRAPPSSSRNHEGGMPPPWMPSSRTHCDGSITAPRGPKASQTKPRSSMTTWLSWMYERHTLRPHRRRPVIDATRQRARGIPRNEATIAARSTFHEQTQSAARFIQSGYLPDSGVPRPDLPTREGSR
jgi:hypothetical protein